MSEEKEVGLSADEIKALRKLLAEESEKSQKPTDEKASKKQLDHPVTREEVARANKRLKLELDMSETELETLIFLGLTAMQEIYGVKGKAELSLAQQFREAVDAVGEQLLEKNKERAGDEKKLNNPVILQALDQIN